MKKLLLIDLDGWQKPNLGKAPARIFDFGKKRRKKKGLGKGGNQP